MDEAGKLWEEGWWGRKERRGGAGRSPLWKQTSKRLELSVVLTRAQWPEHHRWLTVSTAGWGGEEGLGRGQREESPPEQSSISSLARSVWS